MNSTSTSGLNLEYILPPISLFIFVSYMIVFFILLKVRPLSLNLGFKLAVRRRWARDVVFSNQPITAVQTLRNSQNSANVFASASVVVAFFAFQQGSNLSSESVLQSVKFYLLGGSFVAAFLSFGMSVREAEQCGYLSFQYASPNPVTGGISGQWNDLEIPVVPRTKDAAPEIRREITISDTETRADACSRSASHSAFFWAMGLRFFYFCVCIGGWVASPIACICVTCFMVFIMYMLDRSVTHNLKRPITR